MTRKTYQSTCSTCSKVTPCSKGAYMKAKRRQSKCSDCRTHSYTDSSPWFRECPTCHVKVYYKEERYIKKVKAKSCRRCASSYFQKKLGYNFQHNPASIPFFDEVTYLLGFEGQHARNGGEVVLSGFRPDFYDAAQKLIIEWDEPAHNQSKRRKHDSRRDDILKSNHDVTIIRVQQDDPEKWWAIWEGLQDPNDMDN